MTRNNLTEVLLDYLKEGYEEVYRSGGVSGERGEGDSKVMEGMVRRDYSERRGKGCIFGWEGCKRAWLPHPWPPPPTLPETQLWCSQGSAVYLIPRVTSACETPLVVPRAPLWLPRLGTVPNLYNTSSPPRLVRPTATQLQALLERQ